jgi:phosphomevalonate kinase
MSRVFRAPGKLVLVGEYAVLDGAPAVVAAVDHGVACTVTPAPERRIETPGDDRFARTTLETLDAPAARYQFADWNPSPTATKAGLGGSAAAVVCATLAALSMRGERPDVPALFQRAAEIHRAAQGSGSGIDVAASAWGGVVWFHEGEATSLRLDLEPVVVWSGQSARTAPRVEAYLQWRGRTRFVRRAGEISRRFFFDPIGALLASRQLLEDMADAVGLAYRTPALDHIAALAQESGGEAKPSGAGGGDCAVALFPDPEAAGRFRGACVDAGHTVVPVQLTGGAHEVPASANGPQPDVMEPP